MRRNRKADWTRRLVQENRLTVDDLIWPIFVVPGTGVVEPIDAMPGVSRMVEKETTTIVDGAGSKEDISGRVAQIRAQIEDTSSDYDREKLQERLAKLAGGVAVIRVGGSTEVEVKEKKDRVDDALHAAGRIDALAEAAHHLLVEKHCRRTTQPFIDDEANGVGADIHNGDRADAGQTSLRFRFDHAHDLPKKIRALGLRHGRSGQ